MPSGSSTPAAEMPPSAPDDPEMTEQSGGMKKDEPAEVATCACADNPPQPAPKRKPKPVVHAPAPAPAAAPVSATPGEASVKIVEDASASILGKKVRGQDGEDLGRVVDVLADRQGRVRIAIIEFGGFLGVGNRRIAVDWSLLKFQPSDADAPVMLDVSKSKLEGTPEYKGVERPLALTAPAAAVSPATSPK